MSRKPTANKELRTTYKGTTYWYYPDAVKKRTEKLREQRGIVKKENGGKESNQWNSIKTNSNVIKLDSKTNEHYLRYVEKKRILREEYLTWTRMRREEWLEYYQRLTHLMFNDEDFQYYFKEIKKTFDEKVKDQWWEEKKRKDEEYDGHNDDYDWK